MVMAADIATHQAECRLHAIENTWLVLFSVLQLRNVPGGFVEPKGEQDFKGSS